MARPLRRQYPGAFYHITSRGDERKAIFRSNRDRERFVLYLESATELMIGKEHHLRKNLCLFVNHQYGGFRLKEIGAYYGMRGSAVSQSIRRFKKRLGVNDKLRHTVAEIVKQLRFVES